jgi:type IV pilus assembly protein PilC
MAGTTTFKYSVRDRSGKLVNGELAAETEAALVQRLKSMGYAPVSIEQSNTGLQKELKIPGFGNKAKLKDLAIFSRQFATMINSGLSLMRALSILADQTESEILAKTIAEVRNDVEAGSALSAAMGKHPKIFPPLMVNLCKAGEIGGFLDTVLLQIAENYESEVKLRSKIKSAMTYPTIVLSFSFVMVAGVLLFIVPVFSKMFGQLHAKLPLPTRVLVTVSNEAWWILPIVIGAMIAGFVWFRRELRANREFRLRFDRLKLRVPVFGPLFTKIAISRWSRNLGTLLNVGVPVMQALDIVGATAGNEVVAEEMTKVQLAVRDGRTISSALIGSKTFPAMVVQMVEVGEESGQISSMLEKVAEFYDRDVEAASEQLASAIEPIMVVLMGAIVGVVVVALYLPMFTVYQHIQGAS